MAEANPIDWEYTDEQQLLTDWCRWNSKLIDMSKGEALAIEEHFGDKRIREAWIAWTEERAKLLELYRDFISDEDFEAQAQKEAIVEVIKLKARIAELERPRTVRINVGERVVYRQAPPNPEKVLMLELQVERLQRSVDALQEQNKYLKGYIKKKIPAGEVAKAIRGED